MTSKCCNVTIVLCAITVAFVENVPLALGGMCVHCLLEKFRRYLLSLLVFKYNSSDVSSLVFILEDLNKDESGVLKSLNINLSALSCSLMKLGVQTFFCIKIYNCYIFMINYFLN